MTDWLRNLKPGDKLVMVMGAAYRLGSVTATSPHRMTAITDTGKSAVYDRSTGCKDGDLGTWGDRILEPTPDLVDAVCRQRLLAHLDTVRWEDLPTERLEAVWAVVTGAEP